MNEIEYTEVERYASFLPSERRLSMRPPTPTWWAWRDHRVHVARAIAPEASVRALIVHGAGGHAGALWPLAGVAAAEDVEVMVPDLPLYGRTLCPDRSAVRYRDWVDLLCDLVIAEKAADPRPLILFGASMGGLLAYETATRTGVVDAVMATCLLDPGDRSARENAARWSVLGRFAPRTLPALSRIAGDVRVPIRWLTPMSAMSNNSGLAKLCATDPLGGGGRVPLGFLADWFTFEHTPPDHYRGPALTLVHPGADRWTPPEVSERFSARIAGPTRVVRLENCGHYPVEEPGLAQLETTARSVFDALVG
ncbi:alpha/beta hydrolase [Williamsia sp.]|uniref:alpha/beta hydrolase n=1 Tax=Williamsia sp. TaxID=1872085 RepID=UPI002F9545DD